MGKLPPEERWRQHIEERFTALKISAEFEELANEGRRILGRSGPYSPDEWATTWAERAGSSEYLGWHLRCLEVGRQLGLAPWVVEMACLICDYDPYQFPFVVESDWAKVRVVTEYDDPVFFGWLAHHAAGMGLRVVVRRPSAEETLVQPAAWLSTEEVLSPAHRPPRNNAFVMRVETPALYPMEVGRELQAEAQRLGRELLRQLGYQVPQRIRSSSWVPKAKELRVGEKGLPPRSVEEIVVKVYPEEQEADITPEADRKRYSVVTSARKRTSGRLREQGSK